MARNAVAIEKSHPLYEACKRGEEIDREMLMAVGGVLSGKQFSEKLGITPLELARMRKRKERGVLDGSRGRLRLSAFPT